MEQVRKPFQGVLNIIRFNWHFYAIALVFVFLLFFSGDYVSIYYQPYMLLLIFLIFSSLILSLLASLYVYDISDLYLLNWIEKNEMERLVININAGFDETSALLQHKFMHSNLIALDFYNPIKHTEVSVKRARRAYPRYEKTTEIETTDLKIADNIADKVFVIFAAHEIRDTNERIAFFKELRRVIKPTGQIYITEHLRDTPNFLVYNIGFFHFYTKSSWCRVFDSANLEITQEKKLTPFISTFILHKNGDSL